MDKKINYTNLQHCNWKIKECEKEIARLQNENAHLRKKLAELEKESKRTEFTKENIEKYIKKLKKEIGEKDKRGTKAQHLAMAQCYFDCRSIERVARMFNCSTKTVKRALNEFPAFKRG